MSYLQHCAVFPWVVLVQEYHMLHFDILALHLWIKLLLLHPKLMALKLTILGYSPIETEAVTQRRCLELKRALPGCWYRQRWCIQRWKKLGWGTRQAPAQIQAGKQVNGLGCFVYGTKRCWLACCPSKEGTSHHICKALPSVSGSLFYLFVFCDIVLKKSVLTEY